MRVWRVAVARAAAFDGEGTRRTGSRWVPTDLAAVYTSATLSHAALELFVHTNPDLVPTDLMAIPADVPDSVPITAVQIAEFPRSGARCRLPRALHEVGRTWHAVGRTAIVRVLSAIVPAHGHFCAPWRTRRIRTTSPERS
jgi:RES domain-containing protein